MCLPWLLSQTWSSWRFSSRVWTGSSWCEAVAVKSLLSTLKEKAPPCTYGLSPWIPVTGHFRGQKIWLIWRGGGYRKAGPLVIEGPQDEGNSYGWISLLAESTSTVCVHAGPLYPCTWEIEHRDTLYCSFKSGKRCSVLLHFQILSLLCLCCQVTGTHCVQISKEVNVCCWYEPRSLSCRVVCSTLGGLLDLRKTWTEKEVTEWLCVGRSFIIPHDEYSIIRYSLVICTVCVTICTWCFHFKYIWRNCFRSQPQMRSCWNMPLGGTLEPVCSWELHLSRSVLRVSAWALDHLPSGGDVGYLHLQVNNFHPHGTLLF